MLEPRYVEWTMGRFHAFCVITIRTLQGCKRGFEMDTLSNVQHRGEHRSPSVGLIANAIPKQKDSQTGVSVRYAYNSNHHWYVLRASYGREQKAYDYIVKDGFVAYLPYHTEIVIQNGIKRKIKKCLLPNILFVYSNKDQIEKYIVSTPSLSFLKFYYNRLRINLDGTNPPLTVAYQDMINFIEITSINNAHIRVVNKSQCHFKCDDIVRIKEGTFKGIEGRVARVLGQQRVVVTLEGLCTIATAYIPSAFLEIVK